MTTSDFDADHAVPEDDGFALAVEAPVADALEQRATVLPAADEQSELPTELPDDVNPADALDQSRSVDHDDEV